MRKRVAILGSTGSIGTQALDVIARHPDRFAVVGLAAGKQVDKLREQVERFEVPVSASSADGAAGLLRVAGAGGPITTQPERDALAALGRPTPQCAASGADMTARVTRQHS